MLILLTGATGFLGKHLAAFLISEGMAVVAVGRKVCDVPNVRNVCISTFTVDEIKKALTDAQLIPDAIIHLAAAGVHPSDRDYATLLDMNITLPSQLVMLGHAYGVKAVVFAGSSAEYADPKTQQRSNEQDGLQWKKLYGASKAAGGLAALSLAEAMQVPVVWMRLFNLYGAGELPHRLLPSLITSLRMHKTVSMSEGTQVRDFVYVKDACHALWQALISLMEKSIPNGPYNVCSGAGNSVKAFSFKVADKLGVDKNLLAFGAIPLRPDDTPYLVGDPRAFNTVSGWAPVYTLDDGIADAIEEMTD